VAIRRTGKRLNVALTPHDLAGCGKTPSYSLNSLWLRLRCVISSENIFQENICADLETPTHDNCLYHLEKRVPVDHPIRKIKVMADQELQGLSSLFKKMYSHTGRPFDSARAHAESLLLIALFSIRSERQFCEQFGIQIFFTVGSWIWN